MSVCPVLQTLLTRVFLSGRVLPVRGDPRHLLMRLHKILTTISSLGESLVTSVTPLEWGSGNRGLGYGSRRPKIGGLGTEDWGMGTGSRSMGAGDWELEYGNRRLGMGVWEQKLFRHWRAFVPKSHPLNESWFLPFPCLPCLLCVFFRSW